MLFSGFIFRSLVSHSSLNCMRYSSLFNIRVSRRMLSNLSWVGVNEDVVALEKEINNFSNEEFNKNSTKNKIESRVNNPVVDGSVAEFLKQSRDNKGYYYNLFVFIVSEDNLKLAWDEIKGKSGNLSPGGEEEEETLNGLHVDWFKETSKKLLNGTYKYRPARRVHIPKAAGKSGTRQLTIASPRDKIIQQAFYRILHLIYEGIWVWSESSEKEYKEADKHRDTFQKMQKVRRKVGKKYYVKA